MILGGDIYQMHTKKRDPYLKKEDRGMVPGGSDLSDAEDRGMVSVLHQSDIPCSKGERLFRGRSKAFKQGEHPEGEFKQGEHP